MNPNNIRKTIIEQSKRAHVGHIGSCLSIVDILVALFDRVMRVSVPEDPDRDRLILSKGHAALALYAVIHNKGWIDDEALNSFLGDSTQLGVHPEHHLRGVDFSTGSLGQGLSMAAGAALAARLQGSSRQVYAVLSDAELNEGSTWESVMFAAQHKLNNLTAIVDFNRQQALDYTENVINLGAITEKWAAFGWHVLTTDGHDIDQLAAAIQTSADKPSVVIAETTFGYGVSYMQSKIKWHYWPMSDEEYSQALSDIDSLESAT